MELSAAIQFLKQLSSVPEEESHWLATIADQFQLITLNPGESLPAEGRESGAIYLVLEGRLNASDSVNVWESYRSGDLIGASVQQGQAVSPAPIRTESKAVLLKIPQREMDEMIRHDPSWYRLLAENQKQRIRRQLLDQALSPMLGKISQEMMQVIEKEIQWIHLKSGECLFKQGDPGDSLFVLINGKLKAVTVSGAQAEKILGYISRSETVGEMALFTKDRRSATIYATRDSELACFSEELFEKIKTLQPQVLIPISNVIINRLKKANVAPNRTPSLKSIAIFAITPHVDTTLFSQSLAKTLGKMHQVKYLTSATVDSELNSSGISQAEIRSVDEMKLLKWLDDQEEKHNYLLFETDHRDTPWTRRCIRQADRILLVGRDGSSSEPTLMERSIMADSVDLPSKEINLVLLHPASNIIPTATENWLRPRKIKEHFHLSRKDAKEMDRLVRILTNRSIGLVLGGGGSRAYAHIGVLRALKEAGIPIDRVGGTSMGAVIASHLAMGKSEPEMVAIQKQIIYQVKPFREYNLPIISVFGRKRLQRAMEEVYGDSRIEDLRLSSFFMSTNLTKAEAMIHRSGPLQKAVLASMSLPGILPPVVDQKSLLVDGCILNNLPGDVMKQLYGGTCIVVNVNPKEEVTLEHTFQELPTPWAVIKNRLNPFQKNLKIPNIMKIMMRSSMLHTIHQEENIAKNADFYLQPPVDSFNIMELEAIDEIIEVGYSYTKKELVNWKFSE